MPPKTARAPLRKEVFLACSTPVCSKEPVLQPAGSFGSNASPPGNAPRASSGIVT
eukprot:CAMPEP_0169146740 /NCGR_PEP_ID=MMETSP1015-20121227/47778_1 /TAXON_ID=342587 /ORGANISM="Karlodinium micrum, Strain CCMP2283" /LENGTH=54 /DNA_ID=CAMNT_0009214761 /DNA_START=803 /DNA_END=964 /DNA_ORIENTATION=-